MVKYVFAVAPLILIGKKSVTHTNQAIGYTNIPSDHQLALGVSISLVVEKTKSKSDS